MHAFLLFAAAGSLALTAAEPVSLAQPKLPDQLDAARVVALAPRSNDGVPCAPLTRHARGERGGTARKLIDAPPMQLHLAVDRRENGCPVPALAPGSVQR